MFVFSFSPAVIRPPKLLFTDKYKVLFSSVAFCLFPALQPPIKVELDVKPQDLNAEQRQIFVDSTQQMDGLDAFVQNLRRSHNVLEHGFTKSGLEITMECSNLDSLEKLLNDHETGRLTEMAERYLVTEELKMVLWLETLRFETVFKEHSYLEILSKFHFSFIKKKLYT